MLYETMKWKRNHLISIKKYANNNDDTNESNNELNKDLLIDELNILSKLNYNRIIQLLGVCYLNKINKTDLILVFEHINTSLFEYYYKLNNKNKLKLNDIHKICIQICDALIYLHDKCILHCYITSHSILFNYDNQENSSINIRQIKLGNFEYSIEFNKKNASTIINNKLAYSWLSPELMLNKIPTESSDMFMYCCLIWELFNRQIPWSNLNWYEIKQEICVNKNQLEINYNLIPFPYNRIIKDGLNYIPLQRMSFDEIKFNLENTCDLSDDFYSSTKQHQHQQPKQIPPPPPPPPSSSLTQQSSIQLQQVPTQINKSISINWNERDVNDKRQSFRLSLQKNLLEKLELIRLNRQQQQQQETPITQKANDKEQQQQKKDESVSKLYDKPFKSLIDETVKKRYSNVQTTPPLPQPLTFKQQKPKFKATTKNNSFKNKSIDNLTTTTTTTVTTSSGLNNINRQSISLQENNSNKKKNEFYAGFGSVKNLVKSFEHLPFKEEVN